MKIHLSQTNKAIKLRRSVNPLLHGDGGHGNGIADGNAILARHHLEARAVNAELLAATKDYKNKFPDLYAPIHRGLRTFVLEEIAPTLLSVDSVEDELAAILLETFDCVEGTPEFDSVMGHVGGSMHFTRIAVQHAAKLRILKYVASALGVDVDTLSEAMGYSQKDKKHEKQLLELRKLHRVLRQQEADSEESRLPFPPKGRNVNQRGLSDDPATPGKR